MAIAVEMRREGSALRIDALKDYADRLLDIASGCGERGPGDDVSMSAYDLLPAEERESIAWVRDHGGLDGIMHRVDVALTYEGIAKKLLAEIGALGADDELSAALDALEARLMPSGMEWPAFEDGEPVNLGDMVSIDGHADMVEAVQLWIHGKPVIYGDGGSQQLERGERVKRPAPKVLDADGVEIEIGDDLYSVEGMLKFHVSAIDKKSGRIATEAMFALDKWADPKMYTHRAPVLVADGKPLREGETVWHKGGNAHGVVESIDDGSLMHTVRYRSDDGEEYRDAAKDLTHERPDSWGRLENDANAAVCVYFGASVKDCENCDHNSWECSYDKARDLVRRAKALAGVSE